MREWREGRKEGLQTAREIKKVECKKNEGRREGRIARRVEGTEKKIRGREGRTYKGIKKEERKNERRGFKKDEREGKRREIIKKQNLEEGKKECKARRIFVF